MTLSEGNPISPESLSARAANTGALHGRRCRTRGGLLQADLDGLDQKRRYANRFIVAERPAGLSVIARS